MSFTPDGSHANATVTKPAATSPTCGETHWELYGSADDATYYLLATTVVGTTTVADPACNSVRGSMVRKSDTPGSEICGWEYRDFTSLLGAAERANAFATAEYDVTNHTTLFGALPLSVIFRPCCKASSRTFCNASIIVVACLSVSVMRVLLISCVR